MTVFIRPVEERDLDAVKKLMVEYIVDFYEKPKAKESEMDLLVQNLIDKPDFGKQFVAENEHHELVGFVTLYYSFSTLSMKRAAILNDLYVTSNVRGQKVGEKLFSACLDYIRENNYAYMTWETGKDNKIAQALYEKMGGTESEWLTYYIN